MDLASPYPRAPKPRHPRTRPCRYGSDVVRRALPPPGALFAVGAAAALSDEVERRPGRGAGQGSSSDDDFLDERDDGQMDGGQKPNLLVTSVADDA